MQMGSVEFYIKSINIYILNDFPKIAIHSVMEFKAVFFFTNFPTHYNMQCKKNKTVIVNTERGKH